MSSTKFENKTHQSTKDAKLYYEPDGQLEPMSLFLLY